MILLMIRHFKLFPFTFPLNQTTASSKMLGTPDVGILPHTSFQTTEEKEHWKNKWLRDSLPYLQSTQESSTVMPQLRSPSLGIYLFCTANQRRKDHLGTILLPHTVLNQVGVRNRFLITSQADLAEKHPLH